MVLLAWSVTRACRHPPESTGESHEVVLESGSGRGRHERLREVTRSGEWLRAWAFTNFLI